MALCSTLAALFVHELLLQLDEQMAALAYKERNGTILDKNGHSRDTRIQTNSHGFEEGAVGGNPLRTEELHDSLMNRDELQDLARRSV